MRHPKTLYVRIETPQNDEPYPSAFTRSGDAAEDDGSITVVGVYQLVKTIKLRRVVEEVRRSRRSGRR